MFNSNFIQKSSVSFIQTNDKNIGFFYQNAHPASLKQNYDSACSHSPQQIVTRNTNTMSTYQQMFLERD